MHNGLTNNIINDRLNIIFGPRRSGKTTMMIGEMTRRANYSDIKYKFFVCHNERHYHHLIDKFIIVSYNTLHRLYGVRDMIIGFDEVQYERLNINVLNHVDNIIAHNNIVYINTSDMAVYEFINNTRHTYQSFVIDDNTRQINEEYRQRVFVNGLDTMDTSDVIDEQNDQSEDDFLFRIGID